ncbi:MAG: carbamoyltransferase N-terminal domain-containing protein, partial [Flavobacteriales bacterium]
MSTSKKILGIHGKYPMKDKGKVHESSAAFVIDGKLVSAISEDRLVRTKSYGGFPENAIEEVLNLGGCEIKDIDEVAISNLHPKINNKKYLKSLFSTFYDSGVFLSNKIKNFT